MPLKVDGHPADPECLGHQWTVLDEAKLAQLVAEVLLGRAEHAARIISSLQATPTPFPAPMKARLQKVLLVPADEDPWHRDGLLFEIICWAVARMTATADEVVSDPHLGATDHGSDTIKIAFDLTTRRLIAATVYEYKCTTKARGRFRKEVLPAFQEYFSGARDGQLAQSAVALLSRFSLTDQEVLQVYDDLFAVRPLRFQAALTVSPDDFPKKKCVRLFKDYSSLTPLIDHRLGDTFPLADVRAWFEAFAQRVWAMLNV